LASSRTLLHPDPHYRKKPFKKPGAPSKLDKALVAQVVAVAEVTTPVSTQQITALTKTLRRSRASIKKMLEDAKEQFVESAGDYVTIHKEATEQALAEGDNETAAKAAQWAMTNMSFDGARIVDKVQTESTGTRIMIGVKLGGLNDKVIEGAKVEDDDL
jgi:hypothetical protein